MSIERQETKDKITELRKQLDSVQGQFWNFKVQRERMSIEFSEIVERTQERVQLENEKQL